jgi:hypothetical protein
LPESLTKGNVRIYNLLGSLIYSTTIATQKTKIDVSEFTNGVYIIEINCDQILSRQKFIKE